MPIPLYNLASSCFDPCILIFSIRLHQENIERRKEDQLTMTNIESKDVQNTVPHTHTHTESSYFMIHWQCQGFFPTAQDCSRVATVCHNDMRGANDGYNSSRADSLWSNISFTPNLSINFEKSAGECFSPQFLAIISRSIIRSSHNKFQLLSQSLMKSIATIICNLQV